MLICLKCVTEGVQENSGLRCFLLHFGSWNLRYKRCSLYSMLSRIWEGLVPQCSWPGVYKAAIGHSPCIPMARWVISKIYTFEKETKWAKVDITVVNMLNLKLLQVQVCTCTYNGYTYWHYVYIGWCSFIPKLPNCAVGAWEPGIKAKLCTVICFNETLHKKSLSVADEAK